MSQRPQRHESTPAHPTRGTHLFGRDREVSALERAVNVLRAGHSTATLIRGPSGSGRTRMLEEAHRIAANERAVAISIDARAPLEQQLAPFIATPPHRYATALATAAAVRRSLATVRSPLVICVDDMHKHQAATRSVLATAAVSPVRGPVLWLVAADTSDPQADTARWTDFEAIDLPPLDSDAVSELAHSVLGERPDPAIVTYLQNGSRQPLHVHHDLDAIVANRDTALSSAHWPGSVVTSTAPTVCRVLAPAALLGVTFTARELAHLLDIPVGALIRPIRSAMREQIIVESADELRFSHRLLRDAFAATLSHVDVTRLTQRAIGVLAGRGEPAAVITATALEAADRLGAEATEVLTSAIHTVKSYDVASAARLESRLLGIIETYPGDATPIGAALIAHLGQAGELHRARALAQRHTELGGPDVWLARSQLEFPFSFLDARRAATDGLTCSTPGSATHARLISMSILSGILGEQHGDTDHVWEAAEQAAAQSGDESALALMSVNRSLADFEQFDWNSALRRASVASDQGFESLDHSEWWYAALMRANMLRVRGRQSEAQAFIDDQAARAEDRNQLLALTLLVAARASLALDAGELDDAIVHATAALSLAQRIGDERLIIVDVASVLIRVARYRGELRRLDPWRDRLRRMRPEAHRAPVVAELLLIAADTIDDREANDSRSLLSLLGPAATVPSISRDLGDDVLLVRILLRLGQHDPARARVEHAQLRAQRSGSPLAAAVSAHVNGLFQNSVPLLQEAVERYHTLSRPLLAASAREDIATHPSVDHDQAVELLREAAAVWDAAGARRDFSRVSRRLRLMGVRLPGAHDSAAPGLTAAETRVLEEVLKRQTTAEIASVLSISPNTVSVHLRRIYAKAGVTSRAELIDMISRSGR